MKSPRIGVCGHIHARAEEWDVKVATLMHTRTVNHLPEDQRAVDGLDEVLWESAELGVRLSSSDRNTSLRRQEN